MIDELLVSAHQAELRARGREGGYRVGASTRLYVAWR
jgi:hypothetical protein